MCVRVCSGKTLVKHKKNKTKQKPLADIYVTKVEAPAELFLILVNQTFF